MSCALQYKQPVWLIEDLGAPSVILVPIGNALALPGDPRSSVTQMDCLHPHSPGQRLGLDATTIDLMDVLQRWIKYNCYICHNAITRSLWERNHKNDFKQKRIVILSPVTHSLGQRAFLGDKSFSIQQSDSKRLSLFRNSRARYVRAIQKIDWLEK